jgi:signal transduction histidine kinase
VTYAWRSTGIVPLQAYADSGSLRYREVMDAERVEPEPPLVYRVFRRQYSSAQLLAIDVLVVVVLTVARATLMPHLTPRVSGRAWHAATWAAWLLASVAVLFRRRVPAVALAAVLPLVLFDIGVRANGGAGPFYLVMALYSYAVMSSRLRALTATALVAAADVLATVVGGGSQVVMGTIGGVAIISLGWLASENSRAARAIASHYAEREAERATAADRTRAQLVARAVTEERTQIARELHDVVAHAMSVIAVRAGVARMVIDTQPDQARDALGIIETTTRRSLQEMRLLVGVLRGTEDNGASFTPSPGLTNLPELVDGIELAGVAVDVRVEGDPRHLPAAVDLCAYRIIQEALTNVVRHAGPTSAHVLLTYRTDELRIEVRDEGPPQDSARKQAVTDPGGGHGLIGIRERAALFGGKVTAAPDGGGFEVTTSLRTSDFRSDDATTDETAKIGRRR